MYRNPTIRPTFIFIWLPQCHLEEDVLCKRTHWILCLSFFDCFPCLDGIDPHSSHSLNSNPLIHTYMTWFIATLHCEFMHFVWYLVHLVCTKSPLQESTYIRIVHLGDTITDLIAIIRGVRQSSLQQPWEEFSRTSTGVIKGSWQIENTSPISDLLMTFSSSVTPLRNSREWFRSFNMNMKKWWETTLKTSK